MKGSNLPQGRRGVGGGGGWCAAINLALNAELNLDVVLSWQFDLSVQDTSHL